MSSLVGLDRMTLAIEGVEQDRPVRAWITIECGDGYVDGEPQVRLPEGWTDLCSLRIDDGDRERVESALMDRAFEIEVDDEAAQ